MRAFIAIQCPGELKAKMLEVQEKIKVLGDLKLVEPGNIHLTLRFLGEVGDGRIEGIIHTLEGIKRSGGFEVCIKGLGAFPGPGSPRVIWAGAEKGDKELRELHEAVDCALLPLGFVRDERFSSHYTLARVKHIRDKEGLREVLNGCRERTFGCFSVDSFYLMKSELRRTGPVYSVVKEFNL